MQHHEQHRKIGPCQTSSGCAVLATLMEKFGIIHQLSCEFNACVSVKCIRVTVYYHRSTAPYMYTYVFLKFLLITVYLESAANMSTNTPLGSVPTISYIVTISAISLHSELSVRRTYLRTISIAVCRTYVYSELSLNHIISAPFLGLRLISTPYKVESVKPDALAISSSSSLLTLRSATPKVFYRQFVQHLMKPKPIVEMKQFRHPFDEQFLLIDFSSNNNSPVSNSSRLLNRSTKESLIQGQP